MRNYLPWSIFHDVLLALVYFREGVDQTGFVIINEGRSFSPLQFSEYHGEL